MRFMAVAFGVLWALFAPIAVAQVSDNPFPIARGSALPPPAPSATGVQAGPPEGAGAGGIDFGNWRSAEASAYATGIEAQLRLRYAGQAADAIRGDLELNGYACIDRTGAQLHCRIEIVEQECALDWYVVIEQPGEALVAGFDRMCLGGR
jgi:hypothetical protein